MLSKFLKDDGTNIIFIGHYMEIYIPEVYFSSALAEVSGNLVKTFGLLPCSVFDDKDKKLLTETINLPILIDLHLYDSSSVKLNINSTPGADLEPYRALKFYKNNIVMGNSIRQDSTLLELFLRLITSSKIKNVPYEKILTIWQKNLELNKGNLGVPSAILELIIAEIYRNPKNPNEKFSKYLNNNPKASRTDYRASNIREICSRNSTFAAITFEDFDSMLTASLNMNRYNKKQVESPIEKIIKM